MKRAWMLVGMSCLLALVVVAEAQGSSGDASGDTPNITVEDLRIPREKRDPLNDPVEQQRMQKIYEEQKEQSRPKSEAERKMDKIPESTTVTPIIGKDKVGIKVTIPTK